MIQKDLGLKNEALASEEEALESMWPFFLAQPFALAHDTSRLLLGVLDRCVEAGCPPSAGFQERLRTFVVTLKQDSNE